MQKEYDFLSLKSTFDKKKDLKEYLDLSSDMFCVCDLKGRIVYTNASFNIAMGYDLNNLEGKLFFGMVYIDDLAKMIRALSTHKKDKKPIQLFDSRFLTKEGKIKWLSLNVVHNQSDSLSYFSARNAIKGYEEREQSKSFNTAFDKAKEAIIIAENIGTFENPNPAIVYANQTFLDYSGYSFDDIIGKNPLMMRGTNKNETVVKNIKQAMKNWESIDVEVRNQTKHGKNIWVSLSISPITNEEGILTHWISIQKDITDRVIKEEKLRMFEAAVVHSKDSVIITEAEPLDNPEGPKIVYVNNTFCETTGFTKEDAIGKTPRILQGELTSEEAKRKIKKALLKWEPVQLDIMNYKKNREPFWVELSIFPLANEYGLYTHWVSIQRDITERIKLQERLEDKVKERTRALEQSNRKLEAFASVASHDLKAPIRMIVSYLEILKRKFTQKVGKENATAYKEEFEYLGFAQQGAKEAHDLIQGILKYSQIRSEKGDWETIDLNKIIESLLVPFQKDIIAIEANIIYDNLPTIKGHKIQIKQLFQNLISNALKFRGDNPCEVRIEVSNFKKGYLFEVRDNGIGMTEIDKKVIFNLFGRAKTTRKYEGQGIGLSLCKEIIEHHNGKVWVESSPGKGASFYFNINT
jgi:PAS domain S-box-containing protein